MRGLIFGLIIAISLPLSAAADNKSTGEQLDEVLQNVLDAIGLVIRAVPQYELPEVLPNGDIIIRRVQPDEPPAEKPDELASRLGCEELSLILNFHRT